MPWVKFADDYLANEKIKDLGPYARLLDVAGIIYCARELRDGQLSEADVRTVAALAHVPRWAPAAAELCAVGRWLRCADGSYAIHDYLAYQPTRAAVLAERHEKHQAKVAAGRAGGLASAQARAQAKAKQTGSRVEAEIEAEGQANAKQTGSPGLTTYSVSSELNPAGLAGWLPARTRAREAVDPQLLAEHLERLGQEQASRQASQPEFHNSQVNGGTNGADR